jgi:hypothetical protein
VHLSPDREPLLTVKLRSFNSGSELSKAPVVMQWLYVQVIDTTEIYSDPTGYSPSFNLYSQPQNQGPQPQIFAHNRSFCENWGNPVIPWPPVTAYHAANPNDKISQMKIVAGSRIDKWGVSSLDEPFERPQESLSQMLPVVVNLFCACCGRRIGRWGLSLIRQLSRHLLSSW